MTNTPTAQVPLAWLPPDLPPLPGWHVLLLLLPVLALLLAALGARATATPASAWRAARLGTLAALAGTGAALVAWAVTDGGVGQGWRADAAGALVALLVAFIGWAIVKFSRNYLAGEPGEQGAAWRLLATLACALVVVASNHLLVLALAWAGCGLALQGLLGFYGERAAARRAAHKHFVLARMADACMAAALALLGLSLGSWHIDQLAAAMRAAGELPMAAQTGVVLVALAAVLRCAQLPFHGWLIQVMEAPTPVSALLHAGVVNLGGFVLIRLAPLVAETPAAQGLLVLVGGLTAVLAALVTSTRVSVKVALAWSTCAQMGFMLLQCGLGLWSMALLHLVAHSLYKAHAFLHAGATVREISVRRLGVAPAPAGVATLIASALLGAGVTAAAALAAGLDAHTPPALWVAGAIVALALTPLLRLRRGGGWHQLTAVALAFTLALAYFSLHHLVSLWMPAPAPVQAPLWAGVALAFGLLFLLQGLQAIAPQGALGRRLYPWLYGGLFLDEWLSRWLGAPRQRPPAPPARRVSPLQPAATGGR